MSWVAVLGALPWIALGWVLAFGLREPRPLAASTGRGRRPRTSRVRPPVRIVVPARNEARNIGRCLTSLAAQDYPDFEVVVVDDRSDDGTGDLAREIGSGRARTITVLEGAPLPPGWFGKPWACAQGAGTAAPDGAPDPADRAPAPADGPPVPPEGLLLFTDADTEHGSTLLSRAVEALEEDRCDVLTLVGRQELGTAGERLVQPIIFSLLGLRFPRLDRPVGPENARDAIANGQYILVRRGAYEAVGGHEGVRGEVVEDLRLAQRLTRAGHRLTLRGAQEEFSTRMYTSLNEVVDGWTKNLAFGARQAAGWWGRVALPGVLGFLIFWMVPGVVLVGAGALGEGLTSTLSTWAALAWGAGVLAWARVYRRFDVSARFGLAHPVAAGIGAFIVLRSWIRGARRIEWKGRRYDLTRGEGPAWDAGGNAADR